MSVSAGRAGNPPKAKTNYIDWSLQRNSKFELTETETFPDAVSETVVAYWKRLAIDALLELCAARERLSRIDDGCNCDDCRASRGIYPALPRPRARGKRKVFASC